MNQPKNSLAPLCVVWGNWHDVWCVLSFLYGTLGLLFWLLWQPPPRLVCNSWCHQTPQIWTWNTHPLRWQVETPILDIAKYKTLKTSNADLLFTTQPDLLDTSFNSYARISVPLCLPANLPEHSITTVQFPSVVWRLLGTGARFVVYAHSISGPSTCSLLNAGGNMSTTVKENDALSLQITGMGLPYHLYDISETCSSWLHTVLLPQWFIVERSECYLYL